MYLLFVCLFLFTSLEVILKLWLLLWVCKHLYNNDLNLSGECSYWAIKNPKQHVVNVSLLEGAKSHKNIRLFLHKSEVSCQTKAEKKNQNRDSTVPVITAALFRDGYIGKKTRTACAIHDLETSLTLLRTLFWPLISGAKASFSFN